MLTHKDWGVGLCGMFASRSYKGTEFPVHTAAKKVLLAGPDRSGRPALVGLVRQHFNDTVSQADDTLMCHPNLYTGSKQHGAYVE
ncbi:hypothetical protein HaLaN_20496 [Haematococcus lacustris]|uniref:Uncharacterized protein n=1 Tax=Haematococcus lacustris TaxID=44745 RepID=A0A699ZLP6_HAELA|nr:hypothetical protein HaLaN_20496 [Haematococcus lacustris]